MVPTETMLEKPMFSLKLLSNIAVSRAPLWLRSPTLPGLAMAPAKVALRPVTGFITPRQLGPMILIRPRRASARTRSSSSIPSGPLSLQPAAVLTPPATTPPRPRRRGEPPLLWPPPPRPRPPEAGGDDDGPLDPRLHALGDDVRHRRCGS